MEEKKLKAWAESYHLGYIDPDIIRTYNDLDEYKYCYSNEDFYREYSKLLKNKNKNSIFKIYFDDNDETYKFPGLKFVGKKDTYYLKSDQFGFSRPNKDMKYPYDVYLEKVLDTDLNNGENYLPKAKEKVREWMKTTRQVGGSFFWPMEFKDGKYEDSMYNKARGGSKYGYKSQYIQDRVDLTLLEVYQIYKSEVLDTNDNKVNLSLLEGNILYSRCFTDTMKLWLSEFDSFEKFVDFFALTPFVKKEKDNKYVPYNLLSENLEVFNKNISRNRELFEPTMTIKDYERLFDRISEKIKERRKELGIKED